MERRKLFKTILVVVICFGIIMLLGASAFGGDDSPTIKKRAIVGTFVDKSDHAWYRGNNPGEGMADMLITALVKSGKFKVYERAALDEILAEKNLSVSDLANDGVEAGKKLEIGDVLVKGTITEFGYKEKKIGGSIASGLLKKAAVKQYTARVGVDLRIISVGTSEVLWADNLAETKTSTSIGISTDKFSFGDQNTFDEHIVGQATRNVIDNIVKKIEQITKDMKWTGILIVADEFYFIDAGSEIGIKPGMEFDVKRERKKVTHPKTGKILKIIYDEVGVVKATEVEEGVTTVEAVSGTGFQDADYVVFKEK